MDIPLQFYPRNPAAPVADASTADPIVGNRVELQLLTTLKCNLKCSYCSLGVGDVLGSQVHVEYSMERRHGTRPRSAGRSRPGARASARASRRRRSR